jgi:hypothetical protein
MKPYLPIIGLVMVSTLAMASGCAEDSDIFGIDGKKDNTPTASPTPSASPSGTGGGVIND